MLHHLASVGSLVDALDHDLRNAINVIKTADFYLRTKLADADPRILRQVELIDSGCNSAVKILRDIVEYAHGPSPQLSLQTLVPVIGRAVEECGPDRSRFKTDFQEDDLVALIDPHYLRLAVRKLLQRAAQHSPTDSPVTIYMRRVDGAVEILIEDQGPTISEKQRKALFGDPSGAPGTRPTNLTLGLVGEIAALHRGSVRCEPVTSEGKEVGNKMILTLCEQDIQSESS